MIRSVLFHLIDRATDIPVRVIQALKGESERDYRRRMAREYGRELSDEPPPPTPRNRPHRGE